MENKVTGNYLIGLVGVAVFVAVGYRIKCAYDQAKKEERRIQKHLDAQVIHIKKMFNIQD